MKIIKYNGENGPKMKMMWHASFDGKIIKFSISDGTVAYVPLAAIMECFIAPPDVGNFVAIFRTSYTREYACEAVAWDLLEHFGVSEEDTFKP